MQQRRSVRSGNSGNYTKSDEDAGNEKLLEGQTVTAEGEEDDTEDDAGFSDVKLSRSEYDLAEATD